MTEIPASAQSLIGEPKYLRVGDCEVSRTNIRAMCAVIENGNPVYWDTEFATELAGAEIAPLTLLSAWVRPELWTPGECEQQQPLELHFDLKRMFGFPNAIVSSFESVYYSPMVVGDRLYSSQMLKSVSKPKDTHLGRGRFWVIEVEYRKLDGELAGVDSFNCFGYSRSGS